MSGRGQAKTRGCLPDASTSAKVKHPLLGCSACVKNVGDGPKVVRANELAKAFMLHFEPLVAGSEFSEDDVNIGSHIPVVRAYLRVADTANYHENGRAYRPLR